MIYIYTEPRALANPRNLINFVPGIPEESDEPGKGGIFSDNPREELISQTHSSSGDLVDLVYKDGKLYDSDGNLVTNLYKVI